MYKVAILRDHKPESSEKWELACKKANIDYLPIDMMRNDWLKKVRDFNPDFCVSRPIGDSLQNKFIFDEKLYVLTKSMNIPVYPGYEETVIYENKSALHWFLKANGIESPNTFVSSDQNESERFVEYCSYPLVAKTLMGAAGSGVKILDTPADAQRYIQKSFTTGIKRRFGPNRKTGSPKSWMVKAINSPSYFFKKLKQYKNRTQDVQKYVVLFQEFIPHDFEWRIVKIGDSYFGYKKLKVDRMASGAKQFEYGEVPKELLQFTHDLCKKFYFNFMAVDLFYNEKIYVNELQTIFGHKSEAICKVDGKPGRYKFVNGNWHFEEGLFNTNESYDLRLETAIQLYNKKIR